VDYDSWQKFLAHPPGHRFVNNQIREARFLVEIFDRYPDTILVTEVWRDNAAHDWTFVGAGLEQPLDVPKDGRSLPQVVAASVPFARRVMFYRGLDCNLPGEERCLDPPWPVIDERRFASEPEPLPADAEIGLSVQTMMR
jgi:hypothetical protein